ncbi:MAG: hypothetical protein Q9226_000271, partial [Calogaya cf. arnoldii]
MTHTGAFRLETCARPNILSLQPYRCARDDYKDDGTNILLDANENAYGPSLDVQGNRLNNELEVDLLGLNRYPDPPTHDKILTCPPTYGMYAVSAQVNDVEIVKVPLDPTRGFQLQPEAINAALSSDPAIKLLYITSPGNPTANLLAKSDIQKVLEHPTWNGVVVLDEAYIDFSPDGASLAEWVTEWPNLVVMQTLSKAFGLAGIRLGAAFTSPEIARLLNNLKAPYNISSPT